MRSNSEDTGKNIRTILFLVLFAILVLSSTNIQGNNNASSARYSPEYELLSGSFSQHHSTILCSAVTLPDIYKFCECVPRNTDLIPFSIQNKLSYSNNRIGQSFILIQKTRLSAKPALLRRLYHYHLSNEDDIPPVLS
jgi:hypothetical protein